MDDMTVVYYTSNADHPNLEEEVRKTIKRNCGGLPIVCVSHKPVKNFGHNIVVGDIGRSWDSIFTQQKLGLEYAKTKYVAICEADFLLPEKFFQYRPPHDRVYCWPKDGYIAFIKNRRRYYRKDMRQTVGIVGREYLLSMAQTIFDTAGNVHITRIISQFGETQTVDLGSVVTLKTRLQMHQTSPFSRKDSVEELPEWGSARAMWSRYR